MSPGFLTDALIAGSLTLVLAGAAAVVLIRRPARQAVMLSAYGVLLTVMFMVLQAPDVALSQVAVGSAVVPLIVVLAIRKVEGIRVTAEDSGHEEGAP